MDMCRSNGLNQVDLLNPAEKKISEKEYWDQNAEVKKISNEHNAELKKKNKQLTTFSFDFKDNHKYFTANAFQPSMDRPFVDIMVKYLDSDHHYLECDNVTQQICCIHP